MSLLIYGAYGFTGQLIAEQAVRKGLNPIIAGRNKKRLSDMAISYNVPYRVFDLTDEEVIESSLRDIKVLLNCAGPFKFTYRPLVEACIKTNTHYLDITGELEVFEKLRNYHTEALFKNVIILPGVGFDIVPTDCIAGRLHEKLQDASHLYLAFASTGGAISHGTATTIVENLGNPGAVRSMEYIVPKPIGHKSRWVNFGNKKLFTMTIPWGDISTAFHTTGIPNIEVYTAVPQWMYGFMKAQRVFNPILRNRLVKNLIQRYVDASIIGPTRGQLKKSRCLVWGFVHNIRYDFEVMRIETPEAYLFTAEASTFITKKILEGDYQAGYQTPSGLFGPDLLFWIPGVTLIEDQ